MSLYYMLMIWSVLGHRVWHQLLSYLLIFPNPEIYMYVKFVSSIIERNLNHREKWLLILFTVRSVMPFINDAWVWKVIWHTGLKRGSYVYFDYIDVDIWSAILFSFLNGRYSFAWFIEGFFEWSDICGINFLNQYFL